MLEGGRILKTSPCAAWNNSWTWERQIRRESVGIMFIHLKKKTWTIENKCFSRCRVWTVAHSFLYLSTEIPVFKAACGQEENGSEGRDGAQQAEEGGS